MTQREACTALGLSKEAFGYYRRLHKAGKLGPGVPGPKTIATDGGVEALEIPAEFVDAVRKYRSGSGERQTPPHERKRTSEPAGEQAVDATPPPVPKTLEDIPEEPTDAGAGNPDAVLLATPQVPPAPPVVRPVEPSFGSVSLPTNSGAPVNTPQTQEGSENAENPNGNTRPGTGFNIWQFLGDW